MANNDDNHNDNDDNDNVNTNLPPSPSPSVTPSSHRYNLRSRDATPSQSYSTRTNRRRARSSTAAGSARNGEIEDQSNSPNQLMNRYRKMTKPELEHQCLQYGISTDGTKKLLLQRLKTYLDEDTTTDTKTPLRRSRRRTGLGPDDPQETTFKTPSRRTRPPSARIMQSERKPNKDAATARRTSGVTKSVPRKTTAVSHQRSAVLGSSSSTATAAVAKKLLMGTGVASVSSSPRASKSRPSSSRKPKSKERNAKIDNTNTKSEISPQITDEDIKEAETRKLGPDASDSNIREMKEDLPVPLHLTVKPPTDRKDSEKDSTDSNKREEKEEPQVKLVLGVKSPSDDPDGGNEKDEPIPDAEQHKPSVVEASTSIARVEKSVGEDEMDVSAAEKTGQKSESDLRSSPKPSVVDAPNAINQDKIDEKAEEDKMEVSLPANTPEEIAGDAQDATDQERTNDEREPVPIRRNTNDKLAKENIDEDRLEEESDAAAEGSPDGNSKKDDIDDDREKTIEHEGSHEVESAIGKVIDPVAAQSRGVDTEKKQVGADAPHTQDTEMEAPPSDIIVESSEKDTAAIKTPTSPDHNMNDTIVPDNYNAEAEIAADGTDPNGTDVPYMLTDSLQSPPEKRESQVVVTNDGDQVVGEQVTSIAKGISEAQDASNVVDNIDQGENDGLDKAVEETRVQAVEPADHEMADYIANLPDEPEDELEAGLEGQLNQKSVPTSAPYFLSEPAQATEATASNAEPVETFESITKEPIVAPEVTETLDDKRPESPNAQGESIRVAETAAADQKVAASNEGLSPSAAPPTEADIGEEEATKNSRDDDENNGIGENIAEEKAEQPVVDGPSSRTQPTSDDEEHSEERNSQSDASNGNGRDGSDDDAILADVEETEPNSRNSPAQEMSADDRDDPSPTHPMVDDAHEENGEDSEAQIGTSGESSEVDAANLDSQETYEQLPSGRQPAEPAANDSEEDREEDEDERVTNANRSDSLSEEVSEEEPQRAADNREEEVVDLAESSEESTDDSREADAADSDERLENRPQQDEVVDLAASSDGSSDGSSHGDVPNSASQEVSEEESVPPNRVETNETRDEGTDIEESSDVEAADSEDQEMSDVNNLAASASVVDEDEDESEVVAVLGNKRRPSIAKKVPRGVKRARTFEIEEEVARTPSIPTYKTELLEQQQQHIGGQAKRRRMAEICNQLSMRMPTADSTIESVAIAGNVARIGHSSSRLQEDTTAMDISTLPGLSENERKRNKLMERLARIENSTSQGGYDGTALFGSNNTENNNYSILNSHSHRAFNVGSRKHTRSTRGRGTTTSIRPREILARNVWRNANLAHWSTQRAQQFSQEFREWKKTKQEGAQVGKWT